MLAHHGCTARGCVPGRILGAFSREAQGCLGVQPPQSSAQHSGNNREGAGPHCSPQSAGTGEQWPRHPAFLTCWHSSQHRGSAGLWADLTPTRRPRAALWQMLPCMRSPAVALLLLRCPGRLAAVFATFSQQHCPPTNEVLISTNESTSAKQAARVTGTPSTGESSRYQVAQNTLYPRLEGRGSLGVCPKLVEKQRH